MISLAIEEEYLDTETTTFLPSIEKERIMPSLYSIFKQFKSFFDLGKKNFVLPSSFVLLFIKLINRDF